MMHEQETEKAQTTTVHFRMPFYAASEPRQALSRIHDIRSMSVHEVHYGISTDISIRPFLTQAKQQHLGHP
jgi:hypothetical protein